MDYKRYLEEHLKVGTHQYAIDPVSGTVRGGLLVWFPFDEVRELLAEATKNKSQQEKYHGEE